MPISEQLEDAFNDQITLELKACIAYLQMSAHFEADERPGMARWMKMQSDEEAEHAAMFMEFLLDRDGQVRIGTIEAPMSKFDSPLHVFEEALRHEQWVTEQIRNLYRLADELGDLESLPFLQRFLTEQVEEESLVSGVCERIARLRGNEVGLTVIESELGQRTDAEE